MSTNSSLQAGLLGLLLFTAAVSHANQRRPTSSPTHSQSTTTPPMWLGQRITAADGGTGDQFGIGVAVSGNTAMVGAYKPYSGSNGKGTVYVYSMQNGKWVQTQELMASDASTDDEFGCSVTIEGTTAVIGACHARNGPGAAYVFTESSGSWQQTQELTASGSNDFGHSVAISGSTILVGAPFTYLPGPIEGAAYVFTNTGGTWAQSAQLTASDEADGDEFGWSVSLDGSTALIGSLLADINGNTSQGAAYLFTNSGGTWSQTQKLTATDGGSNDDFGMSVSLSGTNAIVGATGAQTAGIPAGAAYVYTDTAGTWGFAQKLMMNNSSINEFGASVDMQGSRVLVGAYAASGSNFGSGATLIFIDQNGIWQQSRMLYAADGVANDAFGWSVSLDGSNILIGADQAIVGGNENQGAAYFFQPADLDIAISAPASATQNGSYTNQIILTNMSGSTSPVATVTATVPAEATFVSANSSQGSCDHSAGIVSCELGQLSGNGGMATANITLEPTGNGGDKIRNTGSVGWAIPETGAVARTKILTPPVAHDGTITATENATTSGKLEGTDPDHESLTYAVVTQPTHGTVQYSTRGGSYTYTPSSNYIGSDSFTFKVNDGHVDSNTATISITVNKATSGGGGGGGGGRSAPLALILLSLLGLSVLLRRRR